MTIPTAAAAAPGSPLEALFEAAGELALHLDAEARITHACGLARVAGASDFAQNGSSFYGFFAEDAQAEVRAACATAMHSAQRVPLLLALRPGLPADLHWMLSGYDTGSRRGVMAVARVLASEAAPRADSAIVDELTGLPNRLLLENRCAHAIALSRRKGSGFSLLLLNLKGFRKVNDAFGVRAGDDLLRKVGLKLQQHLRSSDTVARLGADEFALLMPDMADADSMHKLGHKLLALIEAPLLLDGCDVHISASLGFAMFPEHGSTHEQLLLGATAAVKVARDSGGSCCVMHDSSRRPDTRAAISLETALHLGVNNGELFLVYQPLVDISGKIYGAEALMRWKRPVEGGDGELVSPAVFIPVAEDCGLIHVLGAWALKSAASSIARINRERNQTLTISVNVSPKQFSGPSFVRAVADALAFSGLPPSLLQLEITEGTLMTDPDAAITLLARLTALGVQVAIDDFGTGYSSLTYLKRFKLSALKIDRSFVKDLPSKTDLAICRSVFSLSRDLGLKSVAEGVETQEQWQILRDAGCDAIQGFLFGRPQPLADFELLVERLPEPADAP